MELEQRFINDLAISIGPWDDERHVAYVMNQEQEDPDHPEVHHVGKEDEKHRQGMVQCVLIKVALGPDEHVLEEPSQMLSELDSVEYLHAPGGLLEGINVTDAVSAVPVPPQPGGHERGVQQNQVGTQGSQTIVNDRKDPLNYRITSFLPNLLIRISCVTNIIFFAG